MKITLLSMLAAVSTTVGAATVITVPAPPDEPVVTDYVSR